MADILEFEEKCLDLIDGMVEDARSTGKDEVEVLRMALVGSAVQHSLIEQALAARGAPVVPFGAFEGVPPGIKLCVYALRAEAAKAGHGVTTTAGILAGAAMALVASHYGNDFAKTWLRQFTTIAEREDLTRRPH